MPRNITVTFVDGSKHLYSNVPDEVTPDQIYSRAKSEYNLEVVNIDGGKAEQAVEKPWSEVGQEAKQNAGKSLGKVITDIGNVVLHPVDTAQGVLDIANGTLQKVLPDSVNALMPESTKGNQAKADAAGEFYKKRYGSLEGFKSSLATDPFGVALDASMLPSAGSGLLKLGKAATAPAGQLMKKVANNTIRSGSKDNIRIATGEMLNNSSAGNAPLYTRIDTTKLVDGYEPTLAETLHRGTNTDTGIATLQHSLPSKDMLGTGSAKSLLAARTDGQNAAIVNAIDNYILPQPHKVAYERARQLAVDSLYNNLPDVPVTDGLINLRNKPAFEKAIPQANEIIMNRYGEPLAFTGELKVGSMIPGRDLQAVSQGLKDVATDTRVGSNVTASRQVVLGELNSYINNKLPELKAANDLYSKLSQPLNESAIFEALRDTTKLDSIGTASERLNQNQFLGLLHNKDRLLTKADDLTGVTSFDKALTPEGLETLDNISEVMKTRQAAINSGKAAGSPTAQNLVIGKIPDKYLKAVSANLGPIDFILDQTVNKYKAKAGNLLSQAFINPELARDISKQAYEAGLPKLLPKVSDSFPSVLTTGLTGGLLSQNAIRPRN